MPDEISPEEKLLRLIKGDKDSQARKHPPAQSSNSTRTPKDEKSGGEPEISEKSKDESKKTAEKAVEPDKKKIDAKPVVKPGKKPIGNEIKKKLDQDKNLKTFKSALTKKETGPLKKTDVSDKPEEKTVSKTAVTAVKPASAVKKTEPSAKPSKKDEPQKAEPEKTKEQTDNPKDKPAKLKENIFIHSLKFIFSGFSVISCLLVVILVLSIGVTFWHMRELSLRKYTIPDLSVESRTDTESQQETNIYLPKPFPYFAEPISSKKLFKLVKPPPPPKPPEPEKKEPEKPKIKIETLTRHFVLQGIVYDIGPPQAIIFNKKENKTMFLGNKEMLNDSVKIKKILRGKVILEYEDQTQEMTF